MLTLICIAGIALGLLHRRRAERPALILIASLGGMLFVSLASYVVTAVIFGAFARDQGGGGGLIVSNLIGLWGWVATFIQAASVGGLCYGVLVDRGFEVLNLSPSQPPNRE